jgi:hypothetical protein
LKFQTAITPLLSDLERSIWHRWIPLVKQLLLSQKSSKIKKNIFLRISQKFLFEKKLFDERNPTRLRAMNLAPLDSSRQAASFERKTFENLKKYFFANFAKIFI